MHKSNKSLIIQLESGDRMKNIFLVVISFLLIVLVSGCVQNNQSSQTDEKCQLSLCDCKCHPAGQTPEEVKGVLCGINCMDLYNISGCELVNGQCQVKYMTAAEIAKRDCISLCNQAKMNNDLSNGPCLSNRIIDDWVCDVAHSPRQAVDNDPANQCSEFGKSAKHFIEVDPDCNFIRSV